MHNAPTSTVAQNPQEAFQYFAVVGGRSSAVCAFVSLREQGPDLFPTGRRSRADCIAPSAFPRRCCYRPFSSKASKFIVISSCNYLVWKNLQVLYGNSLAEQSPSCN